MADYKAKIAPFINEVFYVTTVWWSGDPPHRGIDIATAHSAGNAPLYSIVNGTIIRKENNHASYGNYIIMKSSENGQGFLYAHMAEPALVNVGDTVVIRTASWS